MKTRLLLSMLALLATAPLHAGSPSSGQIAGMIFSGQLEAATPALEAFAAEHPDSPELAYLQSRLATAQGDTAKGLAAMRELVAAQPGNAQYHAALGTTLVRHAETLPFMERSTSYFEAISAYRQSVALDENCFEGQIGLANYYLHAPEMAGGSLVKAEEHAREVLRLNAGMGAPLLAQVLERTGKTDEAAAVRIEHDLPAPAPADEAPTAD